MKQVRDTGTNEQSDWLTLAWHLHANRFQKDGSGLSASKIVQAAVAIADADGLSELSISKIASSLNAAPMSIYNHIASKDELIHVMTDVALDLPPESVRSADDWRMSIINWATALESQFMKHPWLLSAPIAGPPSTPNRLLWVEYLLQGMKSSGLTPSEVLDYSLLIYAYVHHATQLKLSEPADQHTSTPNWARYVDIATFPQFSKIIEQGEKSLVEPDIRHQLGLVIKSIEYSKS